VEIGQPNCRAAFDAWAPALNGEDIVAAARKLAALTVHTTAANYQQRSRHKYLPALVNYERLPARSQAVTMQDGFIDYPAFFQALQEGGYSGPVAYEMCSPLSGGGTLENLDRHAIAFLDFMYSKCGAGRQAEAVS
jgi:sugar phosphate isomerase/epimerase